MEPLLVVDDNEEIRTQLKWGLGQDFEVLLARDVGEGLALFRQALPRVALLDLGMPPDGESVSDGLRCLDELLGVNPHTKVVVVTGNGDRRYALTAIQRGAFDFYRKPLDLAELRVIIRRAALLSVLEEENRQLQRFSRSGPGLLDAMLGESPPMLEVFSTIRKVGPSDVPVLITGESGTGKELAARSLHALSMKSQGPFIPVNCGAIPEQQLDIELFGHECGTCEGPIVERMGRIEMARGGTLFLDEIGELSPLLQVKLLRFLQDKTIERVGGRELIPIDTRIVAATNRDLKPGPKEGNFRDDLYYRMSVISLQLPPLRERGGDIKLLATALLQRYCGEYSKQITTFTAPALRALEAHGWPGNIRELENRIKHAVIMCEGTRISPDDLEIEAQPLNGPKRSAEDAAYVMAELRGLSLREARATMQRDLLTQALAKYRGNVSQAAAELGISRPTFYELMERLNVERSKF